MQYFSWFEGLFEATSDKARFVTVIITALVAIFVVLINQILTRKRELKAFEVSKLEELYTATENLSESVRLVADLLDEHFDDEGSSKEGEKDSPTVIAAKAAFNECRKNYFKIRMLSNLHFPSLRFEELTHRKLWYSYLTMTLSLYILDREDIDKRLDEYHSSVTHLLITMEDISEFCTSWMLAPNRAAKLFHQTQKIHPDDR